MSPRRGFASDNSATIHPDVLAAIARVNVGHAFGYGHDELTRALQDRFAQHFGERRDARSPCATGRPPTCCRCAPRAGRWQAVICAETAHLNVDECGAPEAIAGVKLLAAAAEDGKLTPAARRRPDRAGRRRARGPAARRVDLAVHRARDACTRSRSCGRSPSSRTRRGLLVHVDGARLSNAAAALGVSLRELTADVGVDVLSFGGTKNGLLGAEAVVFLEPRAGRGVRVPAQAVAAARVEDALPGGAVRGAAPDRRAVAALRRATPTRWRRGSPSAVGGLAGVEITRPVADQRGVRAAAARRGDRVAPARVRRSTCGTSAPSEVRWMCSWDTTAEDVEQFAAAVAAAVA